MEEEFDKKASGEEPASESDAPCVGCEAGLLRFQMPTGSVAHNKHGRLEFPMPAQRLPR